MTNEEKTKKICGRNCNYNSKNCEKGCETFKDVLEMAQWKDEQFAQEKQQLIDKAVEYINIHTLKTMSAKDIHNIIVDFRQVMKGE